MIVVEILRTKNFPESLSSQVDLVLLLSFAINKTREFIYTHPEYKLSTAEERRFNDFYQRRLQGEPVAYILGKKEFWSLELDVSDQVLIPRPDTELLVEILLKEIPLEKANIADLGTGSGAIALALASEKPLWNISAVDISEDALQVAKHNANKFKLNNINFYQGSWCDALPDKKFDAIVSNPPYISKEDPHLLQGDVRFEPRLALESGDGLDDIRKIADQARAKLKSGGMLLFEHGYDQSEQVQKILNQNGYQQIEVYKDLAGIDRAISGIRV